MAVERGKCSCDVESCKTIATIEHRVFVLDSLAKESEPFLGNCFDLEGPFINVNECISMIHICRLHDIRQIDIPGTVVLLNTQTSSSGFPFY